MELFAAGITSIDVIVVYAFMNIRKGKLILALWTSFLNMTLPFLGFITGELSTHLFTAWSGLLSGVLLALIGIHMLLQDSDTNSASKQLHPFLIALAVSLDNFSVSVSFGMLQLDKTLFIAASGLFTLVLSYSALLFKSRLGLKAGNTIRRFAGLALITMGVMSCFR
ncbi:manganese efflux pump MntP family protein [Sporosarcina limicola]|nr:manganese efflux pump [Sporosarcina limicola]